MFVALQNERAPQQPGLRIISSSSGSSSSSFLRGSRVVDVAENNHDHHYQQQQFSNVIVDDHDDDPIMDGRSEVGDWSQQEQDQFISLILPYIRGKKLSQEEIQLIRMEAQEAHLPPECVDRLIEESQEHYQQQQNQQKQVETKHKKREFDNIEEVDESDNIMAYFSRMASLKEGGHFPRLNTEAIGSFVEEDALAEEVEVDLDVGYVNKSFNMPLDTNVIRQMNTWSDDDGESQNMSEDSAFNRYNPMGFSDAASDVVPDTFETELDAFQSLLVGGASTERNDLSIPANVSLDDSGIVNMGGAGKGSRSGDMSSSQRSKSGVSSSSDWDLSSTQSGKTTMYGYGLELDEWKRKKNIALWQPESSAKALVKRGPFFACQTLALQAVADELNGLLFVHPPNRLQSAKAVQNMIERTKESRKRQEVMDLMRHVPEANTSNPRPWQLPYRERCKNSAGYLGVDQYSLIDTASALRVFDSRDVSPWESRDVLQHFLDEQSISLTHNWFGNLRRKRGNDKIKYKPARPSSMPIPTEPSLQSASEEMDDWTEVLSKASKSWKDDEVNRTASMSVSSEESTSQSCDDETTSRFASTNRSERTHSVTFRSSVLTSSQSTTEAKTYNSSTIDHVSMATGTETSTGTSTSSGSGSGQRSGVASMSVDDDIESTGVSEILDADDDDVESAGVSAILDDDGSSSSSSVSQSRTTRDRYSSSFSEEESSTRSEDDDRSNSGSESSGSFCTEDSESTSSCSWEEEVPECGAFVNVKPKLGERVSRVAPDYTSHLLRSRFRKKYLPRGGILAMNNNTKKKNAGNTKK